MQKNFVLKAKKAVKTVAAIGTGMAMLGATMTGAMALDLKDYPSPFVTAGQYDASNVLVVGANAAASDTLGMVDVATNMQYESKECKAAGGTVSVAGGISEDIPLGEPIADPASRTMDQQLEDDDIDSLWDGSVTFQSGTYDTKEVLELGQAQRFVKVQTGLTSNDDDYQTDVVLESDVDSIKYYYVFDETIQLNTATTTNPLEIKFLGKTLKITDIDTTVDNKFSAYVGTEYFMDVGDAVEVDGKKVTLVNVGEGGSIVIDVDGVVEVVSSTAKTVNGIEIKVDQTFYETVKAQRSASLILGKEAQQTYADGDAYVGENEDDPNWVWNIGNLSSGTSTTPSDTVEYTGPYLGVENDFVWNDASDNPPAIGECIDMPNNYISICLDSLTLKETEYKTYTFELDKNADLSQADNGATTSAAALYFHTNQPEGFVVKASNIEANITTDPKTDKVWLWRCLNDTSTAAGNPLSLGVYYKDTNTNKIAVAGCVGSVGGEIPAAKTILEINYDNTKGTDIPIYVEATTAVTGFNLTLDPYDSSDLPWNNDKLSMWWSHTSADFTFSALGAGASSEEAGELVWNGYNDTASAAAFSGPTALNIGTKDEDHRTRYGIIVRDPKSHGTSDEVVLEIPSDQVQANVVIKGTSASTSSSGEVCTVANITPVTKLDSEIAGSESMYNLILVGGPCANGAVEAVTGLGVTCAGWSLKPGEGIIKLAANGNKVALLVAGTDALDTRRAAKVIANYKDYTLSGAEALVKGTSLTDITVE